MRRIARITFRTALCALVLAQGALQSQEPNKGNSLRASDDVPADVAKPADEVVDERRLGNVFRLDLIPELKEIAPVQPLYVRIRLTNRLAKTVKIPNSLTSGLGVLLYVAEGGRHHVFMSMSAPESYGKSLGPNEHVDWHTVVCIDRMPPDPRRSPRRVFDLPGEYRLWAGHNPLAKDETERLLSEPVAIAVRKPSEDEEIAGEIFSLGDFPPPFHSWGQNAPKGRNIESELRRFLFKYPKSVFADDVRWFLAKQIKLVRYKTETERERNLATAEFLEQLVQIDPKRVSMRRMIYFAKPPHENHLVFRPSLTDALSNPEVQKRIDVPAIIKQLRESPPYFPEDKDLAESMEQALADVEATLAKR